MKKINKKGFSISGWTEAILLSILFIGVLGSVVSNMNIQYGKDFQVGLGSQVNGTRTALISYGQSASEEIEGGEAEFTTAQGLTLKESWSITKSLGSVIWDFITGGFIETITTDYMRLPAEVGIILRVLYFISVILAVIAILFKKTVP